MEVEKVIEGFTDYTVDIFGNIRSYKYGKCRLLKQNKNTKGYLQVSLSLDGRMYPKRVHRLVAEAFLPNPNLLTQINHIDGDKLNNKLENLEWCNNKDNIIHSWEIGLRENVRSASRKSILKCHLKNSKPVQVVDNMSKKVLKTFKSISEASKEFFPNNDDSYVRYLIITHKKDCSKGLKIFKGKEVFFDWG